MRDNNLTSCISTSSCVHISASVAHLLLVLHDLEVVVVEAGKELVIAFWREVERRGTDGQTCEEEERP